MKINSRYFKMGLTSIRSRSIRSWLTIFGIVISIAVILTLFSLSAGVNRAVEETFDEFGRNRLLIMSGSGIRGLVNGGGGNQGLLQKDVKTVESLPYFKLVVPMLMRNAQQVIYGNDERYLAIQALPNKNTRMINEEYNFDENLVEGRFFSEGEKNVAILGYKIAYDKETYFDKPISVKNSIYINGKKFKIIGIYKELGTNDDTSIFIPLEDARQLFNATESVTAIDAIIKDGVNIELAKEKVTKLLERRKGEDAFTVLTPESIIRQFNNVISIVRGILLAIASISLIVGAVGIANNMFTSVLEREKEIGIMKSIGAANSDILQIFIIESGLIGLFGGIAGAILGSIMSFGVGAVAQGMGFPLLNIQISPFDVAFVLLFSFIVGIISGFIPAWSASKRKIIDTLRDD